MTRPNPWKAATITLAVLVGAFLLLAIWVPDLFTPAALTAGVLAIALLIVGGLAADPNRKD